MRILFNRRKITAVTNLILVLLVCIVGAVCFLPEGTVAVSNPYYNGEREGNKVSIMFNVYEGEEIVKKILQELDSRGIKATFFVGGCFIDEREELLKSIVQGGHEVGNHGYFHLKHDSISLEKNKQEIDNTGRVIKALCGVQPTLFAPPSGAFNKNTLSAAESLGYTVVMWSKDTIDWRDSDGQKIFDRATKDLKGGDLILMHPKEHTLEVLPKILDYFSENGFKQTTVSANLFGG